MSRGGIASAAPAVPGTAFLAPPLAIDGGWLSVAGGACFPLAEDVVRKHFNSLASESHGLRSRKTQIQADNVTGVTTAQQTVP
jgi:hypothetical protein